ncbi:hypothetical protein, partial [Pseudomonas viridiflava]|uniref:hypothetical protein n=1 Tax=Pseudomonas viridiflava TaxID=33069 RepID=UPI00197D7476
ILMRWSMRFASPEVKTKNDEVSRSNALDGGVVKVDESRKSGAFCHHFSEPLSSLNRHAYVCYPSNG